MSQSLLPLLHITNSPNYPNYSENLRENEFELFLTSYSTIHLVGVKAYLVDNQLLCFVTVAAVGQIKL